MNSINCFVPEGGGYWTAEQSKIPPFLCKWIPFMWFRCDGLFDFPWNPRWLLRPRITTIIAILLEKYRSFKGHSFFLDSCFRWQGMQWSYYLYSTTTSTTPKSKMVAILFQFGISRLKHIRETLYFIGRYNMMGHFHLNFSTSMID